MMKEYRAIGRESSRSENITFKIMPNGNIRAYDKSSGDKRGISEWQITDPNNISPTIIVGNTIKIIQTMTKNEMKISLPPELKGKKFRIRKLTPKECFRLMGVEDKDIDRMQASGLSNSAQYKLAGNSIVVDVLYHIFRKMFTETQREGEMPSLFD